MLKEYKQFFVTIIKNYTNYHVIDMILIEKIHKSNILKSLTNSKTVS